MKNYLKKRIKELETSNMLPPLKSRAIKECKIHLRAWERIKAEEYSSIPLSLRTDKEKLRKYFEEAKKKLAENIEQNQKPVIFTNSKGDKFREGEMVWYKSLSGRVFNTNINDIFKYTFSESKQFSDVFKTEEEAKAFSFEVKMKKVNKEFVKINGVVVFCICKTLRVGENCYININEMPIGIVETIEAPSDEEISKFKYEQQLDGYKFNEEKRIFEDLKLEDVHCISESKQDFADVYNAKLEIVDERANFD